ncbi:MAG: energy-coupling factor transporter transmembrane protein EcfT [Clostridiales Family XIII bacterium]|jgi:energy-coupling factor transporter transmembrane protein EcfT|nr:energy-coupling factor transporter transmembrane protein EcfT [Clostridiales Family XIII bacterium]
MRRLNPVCKFFGILATAVVLSLFYVPMLNLGVFAACLLAAACSRVPLRHACAILLPALLIAVGMFFSAYHFSADTAMGAHSGMFTDARVWNGLLLAGRLMGFAGLGMLFTLTTNQIDFIRALNTQLKLPARFAYGIIAAWGMFPRMAREYSKTRSSFRARGLRAGFVSPALLLPLLVKSVRWSESMAVAMESKGFGETDTRSHYYEFRAKAADIAFAVLAPAAVVMAGVWLG